MTPYLEGVAKLFMCARAHHPHYSHLLFKNATGGWRIFHAFNKLNDATIPAQTQIPRKDMVSNTMSLSTIFSSLDLTYGFYQI